MAISVNRINTELESLTRRLNFDQVSSAQADAQFSQLSTQMSQLGTQVGQVSGGFMSITQELDIPPELLNEAVSSLDQASSQFTDGAAFNVREELQNVRGVVNRGIVMLAQNPPGLQIENPPSSLNSSLETLTEGAVAGGFNNIVITANVPEAMARQLSTVANVPLTEVQPAISEVLPQVTAIQQQVGPVLNNLQSNLPAINQFNSQVNLFLGSAAQVLNIRASARGLLNDLVEGITRSISNNIRSLLSINIDIPDSVLAQATSLLQSSNTDAAARLLAGYSDLPISSLLDGLQQINTSLSSDVDNQSVNNAPTPTISPTQRPDDPSQPVSQGAALYGLISSVDRDITELLFRVVTFTAPQAGINPSDYPNYHFVIQADGTLNRSAALNQLLDVAGHQNYSLGIIVAARNGVVSPEQITTIDNIMRTFFSLIPYGQVVNYDEIVVNTRPIIVFDFVEHAREHFNYTSVLSNNISSLSTEQIQLLIFGAVGETNTHIDDTPPEDQPGANLDPDFEGPR